MRDLIFGIGLGLVSGGVWFEFGAGWALIVTGGVLIAVSSFALITKAIRR